MQYIHLTEEDKAILHSLIAGNTPVWVFPSQNPDTHHDHHNFYARVYQPALVTAKLESVTWHTLRHTFASRLTMNGQAPSTIAAFVQHSGTDLGIRYAHLAPTHLQGALERVSGFGKAQVEKAEMVTESRQKWESSIPTVCPTGSEQEGQHAEEMQAVERIGAGEGI